MLPAAVKDAGAGSINSVSRQTARTNSGNLQDKMLSGRTKPAGGGAAVAAGRRRRPPPNCCRELSALLTLYWTDASARKQCNAASHGRWKPIDSRSHRDRDHAAGLLPKLLEYQSNPFSISWLGTVGFCMFLLSVPNLRCRSAMLHLAKHTPSHKRRQCGHVYTHGFVIIFGTPPCTRQSRTV